MNRTFCRLLVGGALLSGVLEMRGQVFTEPHTVTLKREYRDGETITYHMKAVNEGHLRTARYEAEASAQVRRKPSEPFSEDFAWSGLVVNGQTLVLTPESQQFREALSLSPEYTLSVPDLSKVQPMLIGPITDLLTFYADVQLAMRQKNLVQAGDHVYVKHGVPNSWADGTYTVFGQDSIDFDITLTKVDAIAREATLMIRHVPPAEGQITYPAAWMAAPVGRLPNNWVEVEKGQGKYSAEVGEETFAVTIKLSIPSGRILSAEMDNPVDILGRDCDDAALTKCSAPSRYKIRRQVSLESGASE
jgi:hypothetical protein